MYHSVSIFSALSVSLVHTHTHTHTGQMQSSLSQSVHQLLTPTNPRSGIFPELFPLGAPISDVSYEMTGSLNVSPPGRPVMEFSHSVSPGR